MTMAWKQIVIPREAQKRPNKMRRVPRRGGSIATLTPVFYTALNDWLIEQDSDIDELLMRLQSGNGFVTTEEAL